MLRVIKLLLGIGILVGAYMYSLMHTTNIVLTQTAQLNKTYQYAANNADQIAVGR